MYLILIFRVTDSRCYISLGSLLENVKAMYVTFFIFNFNLWGFNRLSLLFIVWSSPMNLKFFIFVLPVKKFDKLKGQKQSLYLMLHNVLLQMLLSQG